MRPWTILTAALLLTSMLGAAQPESLKIEVAPGPNPWSSLAINADLDRFQFAIVTDRTGGHRGHVFEDGIARINLLQPDFVMSVGDFIEGYTSDPKELDTQWKEFFSFIKPLNMPFFYVPGNHDVANPTQLTDYRKRLGRDYYHFKYRDVLFLCLNTDDPFPSKIGDAQIAWADKVLRENKDVRWTLVFMHRPLWAEQESKGKVTGMDKLDRILQGRPYTVFTGHVHHYVKYQRHDQRYFTLATTGGGSDLRGPAFGEFDHVAWVTMTKAGPLVANVMLDGVWDENVATEKSKGFMDRLNKGIPMQVSSLFSADPTIESASVKLRFTNDADMPMKVKLKFADNSALKPGDLRRATVVEPNSVKFLEIPLKGVGQLRVSDLGPVPYDWTLSYDSPNDRPPLKIQGTSYLYVDGPLDLPSRTRPVVVDGKLDEWGPLPVACESSRPPQRDPEMWSGPEDCSFRFAVEHDDKNFYFAARVTDDTWMRKSKEDPWGQDGIWLSLDADPEGNRGKPDKEQKNTFWLMLLPGKTAADSVDYGRQWAAAGVQGVCLKTKTGYTAEGVIPYADLAKRLGKPAQAVRVNVTAYDFDPSSSYDQGIYFHWRPDGGSDLDYPGSGTFYIR